MEVISANDCEKIRSLITALERRSQQRRTLQNIQHLLVMCSVEVNQKVNRTFSLCVKLLLAVIFNCFSSTILNRHFSLLLQVLYKKIQQRTTVEIVVTVTISVGAFASAMCRFKMHNNNNSNNYSTENR